MPEVAVLIEKVLISHKEDIKKISSKLNNGTLDGSHNCFQFGKKKISSWSIKRTELNEVEQRNPKYYREYKDNMIQENMVIDIYNEIVDIINAFDLGLELKKKQVLWYDVVVKINDIVGRVLLRVKIQFTQKLENRRKLYYNLKHK